ncbi:MAG: fatty acid desaturase [Myxococcota bacterium]
MAFAVGPFPAPVQYLAAFALGWVNVRLFIFYHDTMHHAIFRKSPFGRWLMQIYGLLILTPERVWKDSHNYHHAHTSKIVGASIGSYPILTVRMYRAASPWQRLQYRWARHWLTMLMGYFTVFLVGMCIRPLIANPRRNYEAALSLALHGALIGVLTAIGGFEFAFRAYLFPLAVSCALGAYLFYAQHNFPDMEIRDRRDWEYTAAALHASSMMNTSPLIGWFTGDIGYHHVHHLNSQIPFYRLRDAMNGVQELQNPACTSLSVKDVYACLQNHLWDPEQGRMLSYREAGV